MLNKSPLCTDCVCRLINTWQTKENLLVLNEQLYQVFEKKKADIWFYV